jgi:hypothetical protein
MEGQIETIGANLRVIMLIHGHPLLYHISLRSSDKWMDVFLKLEVSLVNNRGYWTSILINVFPFLTPAVYNATICPVC